MASLSMVPTADQDSIQFSSVCFMCGNCRDCFYIEVMNRRRFLQSLAAVFTLPAASTLPFSSASAAVPSAAAVPTQARFWGIYMSALHGECTPQALQSLLNIPAADAKFYITQLISEGVIKPNPMLKSSLSNIARSEDNGLLNKLNDRLKMKAKVGSGEHKNPKTREDVEADLNQAPVEGVDFVDEFADLESNIDSVPELDEEDGPTELSNKKPDCGSEPL